MGTVPPGRSSCLGDDGQLGSHLGQHPFPGGRRLGSDVAGEVDAVPLAQHRLGGLDADGGGLCPREGGERSCVPPSPPHPTLSPAKRLRKRERGWGGTQSRRGGGGGVPLPPTAGAEGVAAQWHQYAALPAAQRLVAQFDPAPVLPELQPAETAGAVEGISHHDAEMGTGKRTKGVLEVVSAPGHSPASTSPLGSVEGDTSVPQSRPHWWADWMRPVPPPPVAVRATTSLRSQPRPCLCVTPGVHPQHRGGSGWGGWSAHTQHSQLL